MRTRTTRGFGGLLITVLLFSWGCQQQSNIESVSQPDASSQVSESSEAESSKVVPLAVTVQVDVDARRPAMTLSEYGLFSDLSRQVPATAVIPYEMNSHSFLDHASQQGFVYVPPGETIQYRSDGPFEFPLGTVLIQNIRFPHDESDASKGERLVETRLLIHKTKGWTAVPYRWNKDGTDADRCVIGEKTEMTITPGSGDPHSFTYVTPNMNECKRCHVNEDVMRPIGVTAANLNRPIETDSAVRNQLVHWQQHGILKDLPEDRQTIPRLPDWQNESAATVERRARSWLDVNCSHCHNPRGAASTSGLDLTFEQDQAVRFGVYKPPVAAGRGSQGLKFSIVPQRPDESFLVRRIASTELGIMMPPLGRSTVQHAGVELIRKWISGMEIDEALAEAALNPMKAYKDAINGEGNTKRGEELFHKVHKCITCHRVENEGGSIGPNLSDVGKRTKREYLLESIVAPSDKIVKGYETQVVVLADGRVITGTIQSEDEYELVIADARNEHKVVKDEIDDRVTSDVSTMPTLANLLTVDDVRNLIAYLTTLQTTTNQQP